MTKRKKSSAKGGSASGGKKPKKEEKLPTKDEFAEGAAENHEEKRNLKDLARDIVVSYDARVKVVGEIIEDTHEMMNDFRGKRENMSKELREVLAKSDSLRRKDFDRMMADIVLKQNEREAQVRKMLEDFRKEEEMVAENLRNLLKKGEGIRIKDFKEMMVEIKREQDRRVKETSASVANELQNMRGEVYKMLDNFKKERQSVATAWHEIIGLFHQEKMEANSGDNPGKGRAKGEPGLQQNEAFEKSNQEYDQEKNPKTEN